jgi:hypothetical protein
MQWVGLEEPFSSCSCTRNQFPHKVDLLMLDQGFMEHEVVLFAIIV